MKHSIENLEPSTGHVPDFLAIKITLPAHIVQAMEAHVAGSQDLDIDTAYTEAAIAWLSQELAEQSVRRIAAPIINSVITVGESPTGPTIRYWGAN